MEQALYYNSHEHVIHIPSNGVSLLPVSRENRQSDVDDPCYEESPSTSAQRPASQPSSVPSTATDSQSISPTRRGRLGILVERNPFSSGLWICLGVIVTFTQIFAAIIVLPISRDERPKSPLFAWAIGYVAGCIGTLTHLCLCYVHRIRPSSEQIPTEPHRRLQIDSSVSTSRTSGSFAQASQGVDLNNTGSASPLGQSLFISSSSSRFNELIDHFKIALDCFFAIWFIVGNVWVFGGQSSASSAPNLYGLCIVFLIVSCMGYAMPFILCMTICCCLPCIISFTGREDINLARGASSNSICSLPTYRFMSERKRNGDNALSRENQGEDGIFAAGTEKERMVSSEDAVCCICLARYVDGDDLTELPCMHFFHTSCVDKWLKINALCPLCKHEIPTL